MAMRMLGRAVYRAFSQSAGHNGARSCSDIPRDVRSAKKLWIVAGATVVGGVIGLRYSNVLAADLPIKGESNKQQILKTSDLCIEASQWDNITPPKFTVSRKVDGPTALNGIRLTLFQYQTCPFCCKVRAFLDFSGIPYDVVEVDPVLRQQIKFSTYKKVPILLVQQENNCWQLNDSTVIISILQSFLLDQKHGIKKYLELYQPMKTKNDSGKEVIEVFNKYNIMYGSTDLSNEYLEKELRWRKWADDVLVHVLSPNIYRSREEALQAFNYFSRVGDWERLFPAWERYLVIYVGAAAMYFVGKRLKTKYNLKDDVRISFYEECDNWVRNLSGAPFNGGNKPNLADLAVFGVLNSIEGCSAFEDILRNTKIQRWYEDTKTVIRQSQ